MIVNDKIKELRKKKNISQTELANTLAVSPQTVSKWENNISSPDISLLAKIAHYFEISIDVLFDYRFEPLYYKDRFIRFLFENQILSFGEYTLKSGRTSPYYINSGRNQSSRILLQLGSYFAECIREYSLMDSCLIGTDANDATITVATAMDLICRFDTEISYCNDPSSYKYIKQNKDLILLTDTFTSGKTIQEKINLVNRSAKRNLKYVIVGIDRMEQSDYEYFTAREILKKIYGVQIFSIITLDDIIRAVEKKVIPAENYLSALYEYKKSYAGVI